MHADGIDDFPAIFAEVQSEGCLLEVAAADMEGNTADVDQGDTAEAQHLELVAFTTKNPPSLRMMPMRPCSSKRVM